LGLLALRCLVGIEPRLELTPLCLRNDLDEHDAGRAPLSRYQFRHVLRHTYATWLEDAGIPGRVIDELMGHDNAHRARQDRVSRIGMGYRDTTPEMLLRAVAAIESRLTSRTPRSWRGLFLLGMPLGVWSERSARCASRD
jgi:Phage integrase family